MGNPSIDQLRDWQRRLMRLVDEMERAYGVPGDHNQDALDSAVHVACYVACSEVKAAEQRADFADVLRGNRA